MPPPREPALAVGTIGWVGDGGFAYDFGSEGNDGVTLVRVTMFGGKDPTQPLNAGVGQGQQLLCQIATDIVVLPVYGSRVLVARPDPCPNVPGHSLVISTLGNSAWKASGNATAGDLVIPCPAGPGRIVMRQAGSFSYITQASDGSAVAFSVGPDGAFLAGPFGSISFDQYGLRGNVGGGPTFNFANVGGMPPPFDTIAGSLAHISAGTIMVDGISVNLGPATSETVWVPTCAYDDAANPPAPAPLLNSLVGSIPPLLAALNEIAVALAANPQYTGITPAQVVALEDAITGLTLGANIAGTILTTTCVKVGYTS